MGHLCILLCLTPDDFTRQRGKCLGLLGLNNLKNDDSIIIKEAEKGGAAVIMDKTFYREKIYEMLADKEHYTEVTVWITIIKS